MIDHKDPLEHFREQLRSGLDQRGEPPSFEPIEVTPWIAMSLLQKAIRRGCNELALRASATLLQQAADRLWKRCGCIAFEDIGIADPETVGLVTVALEGKRIRADLGGEWAVASLIVERMATARRSRASDDLLMSIERHPSLNAVRRMQAELSIPELGRIVLGKGSLHDRALALWYVLGTDRRPSRYLPIRRGEPAFVFHLLEELGTPRDVIAATRLGFKKTREVLCPFVGLLTAEGGARGEDIEDDPLPPTMMMGPVPGWALDQFTREGRAAFGRFLRSDCRTAVDLRSAVSAAGRIEALGGLVFALEGGLLTNRLRSPVHDELRRLVDIECHGPELPNASKLLETLRADLPILNAARADVLGGARHVG